MSSGAFETLSADMHAEFRIIGGSIYCFLLLTINATIRITSPVAASTRTMPAIIIAKVGILKGHFVSVSSSGVSAVLSSTGSSSSFTGKVSSRIGSSPLDSAVVVSSVVSTGSGSTS